MEGTECTFDRLQKQRILPSSEIPPHEFLFTWHDIPCFARGELVAVTGKAKSGKTYLNSILMAVAGAPRHEGCKGYGVECKKESFLGLERMKEEPLKVLWIDTEQSEDSTHEILRDRIGAMIGEEPSPERFYVFNLRQVSLKDRELMVETAIYCYQPDLVIFDGIRDIVSDINDYAEAQRVIGILLSIASDKRTCIVCVLHQNKAIEDKTMIGCLRLGSLRRESMIYRISRNLSLIRRDCRYRLWVRIVRRLPEIRIQSSTLCISCKTVGLIKRSCSGTSCRTGSEWRRIS